MTGGFADGLALGDLDSDGDLVRRTQRLEDLHGLRGIGQRLAVDVLDEITRPEPERGKLAPVTSGVYAVALLLPVDEVGRRADYVGQPRHVL